MSGRPPSDARDPIVAMLEYLKEARRGDQFHAREALVNIPQVYADGVTSRYDAPAPLHYIYADAMLDVLDLASDAGYLETSEHNELLRTMYQLGEAGVEVRRPSRDQSFVMGRLGVETSIVPSEGRTRDDVEQHRDALVGLAREHL